MTMSSYTAIIKCKKCGKVLAEINAYHEPRPNWFVPQDIMTEEFGLSSIYCQDCLNGITDVEQKGGYERINKETTFDDFLKEQLKDPEFKKEWEKLCDEDMRGKNSGN